MSPLTKSQKVSIWVAIVVAIITSPWLIPWIIDSVGQKPAHINGAVSDALTKAPVAGIVVQLKSDEGKLLTQDTSDREGKFNLEIPSSMKTVRLFVAAVNGFEQYEIKLPAKETQNDIQLVKGHMESGLPDGTPLDKALQIVAGKLNITIVFARGCTKKDISAPLNGGHVEGDPRAPEPILRDVLNRVKGNSRYNINEIEAGKRYEVSCF